MQNQEVAILIVDDEATVRDALSSWFRKDGYVTETAADAVEALKLLPTRAWDVVLLDIKMPSISGLELQKRIAHVDPGLPIIMITAYASVDTAVEALKEGAFDYVTKPIDPDDLSRIVRKAIERHRLKTENLQLKKKIEELAIDDDFVGVSSQVQKIHEIIDTVAATDSSVVIRGESGTGKELIARRIHAKSARMYSPLVPVNCGGLSETLLESELFGHEKGAFTGAQYRHRGKLEMANAGTLFLDEIGTISMKTQIELLRVLDTKQFTRLGGTQVITVDFRLICATNQDLEDLVRRGLFREDFYYRINVFPIFVPPLRDRPADIPMLVQHFLDKFSRQINKKIEGISPRAMETIMACPWPGNVRELKNAIERAVVVASGPMIEPEDLPVSNGKRRTTPVSGTLEAVERVHIAETLEQAHWNITRAAQTLGIDRVTLYNKIKKYGLSRTLPSHP